MYASYEDLTARLEYPVDQARAEAALEDAAVLIDGYCRRGAGGFEDPAPGVVKVVNISAAARLLAMGWAGGIRQEGVGGYSVTYESGMPVGLTKGEEQMLSSSGLRVGSGGGSVQLTPSGAWVPPGFPVSEEESVPLGRSGRAYRRIRRIWCL